MTKSEAADVQARVDSPNGSIFTMDIRALLADRAALIEALRPFATDAPRLVYRIAALRPDCEAAVALLKSLGELEEK
jgi:hypothetical protein